MHWEQIFYKGRECLKIVIRKGKKCAWLTRGIFNNKILPDDLEFLEWFSRRCLERVPGYNR